MLEQSTETGFRVEYMMSERQECPKMVLRGQGKEQWVVFHLCRSHTASSHHCLSCGIQRNSFLTDPPASTLRPTKHAAHSGQCGAL